MDPESAEKARRADIKNAGTEELQQRIQAAKERDRKEKQDDAIKEAERAEGLRQVAEALAAGKKAFAAGEFASAERQFDIALLSNIDDRHIVVTNRSACCFKLGRFADAVADAAEATSLEPSYVKGHYRLAMAQRANGNLPRALRAARAGLRLQPDLVMMMKLVEELEAEEATAASSSEGGTKAQNAAGASRPQPAQAGGSSSRAQVEAKLAKLALERGQASAYFALQERAAEEQTGGGGEGGGGGVPIAPAPQAAGGGGGDPAAERVAAGAPSAPAAAGPTLRPLPPPIAPAIPPRVGAPAPQAAGGGASPPVEVS